MTVAIIAKASLDEVMEAVFAMQVEKATLDRRLWDGREVWDEGEVRRVVVE